MNTLKKISLFFVALLLLASCSKMAPLGLDRDGKGDSGILKGADADIVDGDDDGDGDGSIVDGDDDGDDALDASDKPNGGIIDGDDDGDEGLDTTKPNGGIIDGDDDGDDSIDNTDDDDDRNDGAGSVIKG